jgi:hypothetical protein
MAQARASSQRARGWLWAFPDLLAALTTDDDSEWKEWKAGKPLTAKQLSSMLTTFGIAPGRPVIDGRQQRGYSRSGFLDAWERYL